MPRKLWDEILRKIHKCTFLPPTTTEEEWGTAGKSDQQKPEPWSNFVELENPSPLQIAGFDLLPWEKKWSKDDCVCVESKVGQWVKVERFLCFEMAQEKQGSLGFDEKTVGWSDQMVLGMNIDASLLNTSILDAP